MLQRICLVLSVCALVIFFVGGLSQAGWSGLGLTSAHDASSLVISVKKHKHNDDDNADDDNGLEQCTIQKPGSGMGCVAPLKLKCEKMKGGKQCCGCVGDKSSKATTTPPPAAPKQICCSATAIDRDNNNRIVQPGGCGTTQEAAESQTEDCRVHKPLGYSGRDFVRPAVVTSYGREPPPRDHRRVRR